MTETKNEIKISKNETKRNFRLVFISLLTSFLFLFIISLLGEIEVSNVFGNPRNLIYKGLLADKEYGYSGSGNLEENLRNYDPNSNIASSPIQDDSYFTVERNFILDYESFDKITFKHKLLIFYLPLIFFEKFWLWMILTVVLFLFFKFRNRFNKKYKIKFE